MSMPAQPQDSWASMLRARLLRNRAIKIGEREPDGTLEVAVPLEERWWNEAPLKWVFPFRRERRLSQISTGSLFTNRAFPFPATFEP